MYVLNSGASISWRGNEAEIFITILEWEISYFTILGGAERNFTT